MTAMQRIGRSLGIVAVFAVLGPIVVAAALLAVGLAIGIPLTLILLLIFDFKTLWQLASPILFVVVMLVMLGTLTPALLSGIAFAVAAVYMRAKSQ
jgi:hypothetical protein